MKRILLEDKLDLRWANIDITEPVGSINDPSSKLSPFMIMAGIQPVDAAYDTLLVPRLFRRTLQEAAHGVHGREVKNPESGPYKARRPADDGVGGRRDNFGGGCRRRERRIGPANAKVIVSAVRWPIMRSIFPPSGGAGRCSGQNFQ